MDCSIIIPHYDQVNELRTCLTALRGQVAHKDIEIIIVDVDGIGKEALEAAYPDLAVRWVLTSEKNPYSARNQGISNAKSEHILLLDAKCIPQADYVSAALARLRRDAGIVTGPYHVVPRSDKIKDQVYGIFHLHSERNIEKAYGITGGNLGFSKQTFEDVGPFETSHVSGMDIAWSKRALSQGYQIEYIPDMKVSYPGQPWTTFLDTTKKYQQGILHQHRQEGWTILKKVGYGIKYLLPMRLSTFSDALRARSLSLGSSDKWYLWLKVWHAKTHMARAYFRSMIK